jgi:hypothetical protein
MHKPRHSRFWFSLMRARVAFYVHTHLAGDPGLLLSDIFKGE